MQPITLFLLAALFVFAVIVIIKVVKMLVKVAAVVVIAALAYFFFLSDGTFLSEVSLPKKVFNELTLTSVLEDTCEDTDSTQTLYCDCVVQPIYYDLSLRYSEDELSAISQQGSKSVKVLQESLQRNKAEIRKCLMRKKGSELLTVFEDFVQNKAQEIAEETQERSH